MRVLAAFVFCFLIPVLCFAKGKSAGCGASDEVRQKALKGKSCQAALAELRKCESDSDLLERIGGPQDGLVSEWLSLCAADSKLEKKVKEAAQAAGKDCYPKPGEDGFEGSLGAAMSTRCRAEKFLELLPR